MCSVAPRTTTFHRLDSGPLGPLPATLGSRPLLCSTLACIHEWGHHARRSINRFSQGFPPQGGIRI